VRYVLLLSVSRNSDVNNIKYPFGRNHAMGACTWVDDVEMSAVVRDTA
jgi:hypothetical protein